MIERSENRHECNSMEAGACGDHARREHPAIRAPVVDSRVLPTGAPVPPSGSAPAAVETSAPGTSVLAAGTHIRRIKIPSFELKDSSDEDSEDDADPGPAQTECTSLLQDQPRNPQQLAQPPAHLVAAQPARHESKDAHRPLRPEHVQLHHGPSMEAEQASQRRSAEPGVHQLLHNIGSSRRALPSFELHDSSDSDDGKQDHLRPPSEAKGLVSSNTEVQLQAHHCLVGRPIAAVTVGATRQPIETRHAAADMAGVEMVTCRHDATYAKKASQIKGRDGSPLSSIPSLPHDSTQQLMEAFCPEKEEEPVSNVEHADRTGSLQPLRGAHQAPEPPIAGSSALKRKWGADWRATRLATQNYHPAPNHPAPTWKKSEQRIAPLETKCATQSGATVGWNIGSARGEGIAGRTEDGAAGKIPVEQSWPSKKLCHGAPKTRECGGDSHTRVAVQNARVASSCQRPKEKSGKAARKPRKSGARHEYLEDDAEVSDDVEVSGDEVEEAEDEMSNVSGLLDDDSMNCSMSVDMREVYAKSLLPSQARRAGFAPAQRVGGYKMRFMAEDTKIFKSCSESDDDASDEYDSEMDDFIVGSDVSEISIHSSQGGVSDEFDDDGGGDGDEGEASATSSGGAGNYRRIQNKHRSKNVKETTNRDKRGRKVPMKRLGQDEVKKCDDAVGKGRKRRRVVQASMTQLGGSQSEDRCNVESGGSDHVDRQSSSRGAHRKVRHALSDSDDSPASTSSHGAGGRAFGTRAPGHMSPTRSRRLLVASDSEGGGKVTDEAGESASARGKGEERESHRGQHTGCEAGTNVLKAPALSQLDCSPSGGRTQGPAQPQKSARSGALPEKETKSPQTRGQAALSAALRETGVDAGEHPELAALIAVSVASQCSLSPRRGHEM